MSGLKRDIDAFTAEQREKQRQEEAQAEEKGERRSASKRNPFLDIDLNDITEKQMEDAKKSGLDLGDPK